ncbi:hypothetical protein J6590_015824 [Homalodisca vitripennis]|nr:hypothetical protein J6590_015824 [Homalodisca vitripennis]
MSASDFVTVPLNVVFQNLTVCYKVQTTVYIPETSLISPGTPENDDDDDSTSSTPAPSEEEEASGEVPRHHNFVFKYEEGPVGPLGPRTICEGVFSVEEFDVWWLEGFDTDSDW